MSAKFEHFGETDGPRDLYEAGVMLVALAGALDEALTELERVRHGQGEPWLLGILRRSVMSAKGVVPPAGTPEERDAKATRKAVRLLVTLFRRKESEGFQGQR